jgi:hypothetical protein
LRSEAGDSSVSGGAAFVAEHSEVGAALLDYFGGDLDDAKGAIAQRYIGEHASLADYVQEAIEETTNIAQPLR